MAAPARIVSALPTLPRRLTTDERLNLIDRRLDAMSAELREMLTITRRLAAIIDGDVQHAAPRP
jgi:hypothetical protein